MYYVITIDPAKEMPEIVGMYTDKEEANDHYNELQIEGENCDVLEPSQDIGF